jgi:hypothetical protein
MNEHLKYLESFSKDIATLFYSNPFGEGVCCNIALTTNSGTHIQKGAIGHDAEDSFEKVVKALALELGLW